MVCSHCQGKVVRDIDPFDGPRMVCMMCGRSPRITPLAEWYAKQERPTEQYYKTNAKTPPTRKWE